MSQCICIQKCIVVSVSLASRVATLDQFMREIDGKEKRKLNLL